MSLEDALSEAKALTADFSATSEDFENLPEGPYLVEITGVKGGKTKEKALPKVVVTYKVVDGPLTGRLAFDHLLLGGKTAWKLRKMLKAAGQTVNGQSFTIDPDALIGRRLYITVDDEGWCGEWRPAPAATGSGLE